MADGDSDGVVMGLIDVGCMCRGVMGVTGVGSTRC